MLIQISRMLVTWKNRRNFIWIYSLTHLKMFIEHHLCVKHQWGAGEYMVSKVDLACVIVELTVIQGGQTVEQFFTKVWYVGALYEKEMCADQVLLKTGEGLPI